MSAIREAVVDEIPGTSESELSCTLAAIRRSGTRLGKSISGAEFIRKFGGLIPPDELDRMDEAIRLGREGVEQSGE